MHDDLLAKVCEVIRSESLGYKFKSHLNQSLMKTTGDDDWNVFQKSLGPCFEQMQLGFLETFLERMDATGPVTSPPSRQLDSECKKRAAEALLSESMSAIQGSLKSVAALTLLERYQTRPKIMLRRCIEEDALSLAVREIVRRRKCPQNRTYVQEAFHLPYKRSSESET